MDDARMFAAVLKSNISGPRQSSNRKNDVSME